jgi:hypothetical protein
MKYTRNQGITLVAIVITIIILLILAGVAIALFMQEDGLLIHMENAKTQTSISEKKEIIKVEINDLLIENATNQKEITDEALRKILEDYGELLFEENKTTIKGVKTEEGHEILLSELYTGKIAKVANEPKLTGFNPENTYYVSWDLSSTPYNIIEKRNLNQNPPSDWYDYTSGQNKWANIKTIGGGNDCYWVWIPRYAYKVPDRESNGETIEIKFLRDATNFPLDGTEEITNTNPEEGLWVVHPAFTNVGNGGFGELTGIWVSKFEASSNIVSEDTILTDINTTGGGDNVELKVRSIPNVVCWRGITAGSIFKVCQNMKLEGNTLENTTNLDPHMIKNTEWGAVAYLSRSIYGINSAVYNNPYAGGNRSSITGLCGNHQDYTTSTYEDENVYRYNELGGGNASTTGNVYGIYDMAGGAFEYVAGIWGTKQSNGDYYDFSDVDPKYYDSYTGYNSEMYGDAVYETSINTGGTGSWDFDYSNTISESKPIYRRGGRSSYGKNSGIFCRSSDAGQTYSSNGFRPCLIN